MTLSQVVKTDILRVAIGGLAVAAAVGLLAGEAAAQMKFTRTIEMISHAAPGGGTDITARLVMLEARKANLINQDFVVVYKRAGSGSEAHGYLKSQPADGHTLLALTQTHLYTIAQGKSPLKINDLLGVARAMDDPTYIVVPNTSPYKTIEDLIAASKDKQINFAVAQVGGTEHIGVAQFAKATGLNYKITPFGSGGKMVNALLSGATDASPLNASEALGQIQEGKFRPLLLTYSKRLSDTPNVPTSYEKGWPLSVTTTRGYAVIAGTPPAIVKAWSDIMTKAMQSPEFTKYLKSAGLDPADNIADAATWDKALKEEYAASAATLKELGIK
jgi:putative tricarboxylic transport membrane protein